MEIRKALGEQAFLCLYLARDTSEDGTPNPAYQDAATAIRTAAAKIARAHNHSNNARPYHKSKQHEAPPEDHHANFQIQLDRPTDPQAVRKALNDAGIGVQDCHPTTQEFEGYVFTQENIAHIWNYETGYSRCSGECSQDEARHQSWTELHEDQQAAFTQSYQEYIEDQREFEFLPGGPLQNDPKMRTVRMSPHF